VHTGTDVNHFSLESPFDSQVIVPFSSRALQSTLLRVLFLLYLILIPKHLFYNEPGEGGVRERVGPAGQGWKGRTFW
jgi:hypothetical protein